MNTPRRKGTRQPQAYSCSRDRVVAKYHANRLPCDDRELLAVALPRRERGALLGRRRFQEVCRGWTDLAAARESLNQPRHDQNDWSGQTDLRVGRGEADKARTECHQHERERQRRSTADPIRIRPDDSGAERPRRKPTPNVASAPSSRPISDSPGKERLADHHGEKREDEKVVELEPIADDDRYYAFEGQGAVGWTRALVRRPARKSGSRLERQGKLFDRDVLTPSDPRPSGGPGELPAPEHWPARVEPAAH